MSLAVEKLLSSPTSKISFSSEIRDSIMALSSGSPAASRPSLVSQVWLKTAGLRLPSEAGSLYFRSTGPCAEDVQCNSAYYTYILCYTYVSNYTYIHIIHIYTYINIILYIYTYYTYISYYSHIYILYIYTVHTVYTHINIIHIYIYTFIHIIHIFHTLHIYILYIYFILYICTRCFQKQPVQYK